MVEILIAVAAVVAVVVMTVVVLIVRSGRSTYPVQSRTPAVDWAEAGRRPGVPPPPTGPEMIDRVRELKHQGRRIQAVKLLRDSTGVSLREAKDAVDQL